MVCVLCGKRENIQDGFCPECLNLIYRNNDRLEYIKVLQEVATHGKLPPKLREKIEKMLEHIPPFDAKKEYP